MLCQNYGWTLKTFSQLLVLTFVFDHEPFVEGQIDTVHAKLPRLRALGYARARIVPDQVSRYQCATRVVYRHHLQVIISLKQFPSQFISG